MSNEIFWNADKVTAFADECFPEIQPPISALEAEALSQLANCVKLDGTTLNTPLEAVRFSIVTAVEKQRYGEAYEERSLALNGIFQRLRH